MQWVTFNAPTSSETSNSDIRDISSTSFSIFGESAGEVDGVAVAVAALEYLARNKMLDTERIN
jgi:hypothetical protein